MTRLIILLLIIQCSLKYTAVAHYAANVLVTVRVPGIHVVCDLVIEITLPTVYDPP